MSLAIKCVFDPDFRPNGMDPLGKLVISDERSSLSIELTYLDSWLAAIINSLPRLKSSSQIFVEVQEEPERLALDVAADKTVTISHKGQQVTADGPHELELALRSAAKSFLDALAGSPEVWQNRFIDPIRRFLATTQN